MAGLGLRGLMWVGLGVIVLWLPSTSDDISYNATQGVIFAFVGLSMNLLVGYTGQLSLGHQGFVGLGALAAANITASGLTAAEPLSFAFGLGSAVLL
jgi:branched-chain amino acid transport system permease protein